MWLGQWILANFHHTVRSTQNCILYTPGIAWVSQTSLRIENSTKHLPADFEHCICWLLAQVACRLCGWHNSGGHPNSNDTRGCRLMCHFFVLTTFDVICGLFLNRCVPTGSMYRGEEQEGKSPSPLLVHRREKRNRGSISFLPTFSLISPSSVHFPYFSLLPSFFPYFSLPPTFLGQFFPPYSVPPLSLWLYRKITREGTDS